MSDTNMFQSESRELGQCSGATATHGDFDFNNADVREGRLDRRDGRDGGIPHHVKVELRLAQRQAGDLEAGGEVDLPRGQHL